MVSSDRAKPSPHRSLYQFTQLFSRSSRNGKRHAGTTRPMTGFLQADGTVAGNQSGDKQSCADMYVLWRSVSEFKSDSDGTRSGTPTRLSCEVSGQSSK